MKLGLHLTAIGGIEDGADGFKNVRVAQVERCNVKVV